MLRWLHVEHLGARLPWLALAGILLVGAVLRLSDLGTSPPGLNQDESVNSWNAWCLLKTGRDQTGEPWPVFAMRAHGVYSSPLFAYWSMPFRWLGGLSIWNTRFPAALAGVLTLVLIYQVGSRMCGSVTGLAAAALLAVNPWHIHESRWGHEATLCPFLVMAAWGSTLWAGLPIMDDPQRKPRIIASAVSGALWGIGLYGYPAMRAYLPALLMGMVLATATRWKAAVSDRIQRRSVCTFLLAGLIVAAPLAWKHVTDHDRIGQQFDAYRLLQPRASFLRNAEVVFHRYACHFDPHFLFLRGGTDRHLSPPGGGMFDWYILPLWVAGCAVACARASASPASRVLLVAVAVYPIGDCVAQYDGAHPLRSLPGLCGLILVSGLGFSEMVVLISKNRTVLNWLPKASVAALAVASILSLNARRTAYQTGHPGIYHPFHVDLVEACEWLRPRLASIDAVFVTPTAMNMPYSVMLVALRYDPKTWLCDVHEIETVNRWDHHKRFGTVYFLYKGVSANLQSLSGNGRQDRVVVIVRPGELRVDERPVRVICRPDGCAALEIYDLTL